MGLLDDLIKRMAGIPADPPGLKSYEGISNPSGAVALNQHAFIVADDEDNDLRIYARADDGKSLQKIKLDKLFKGVVKDGKGEELDIESGAEIDGVIFWLGSHSTNREGKPRPARHCLLGIAVAGEAEDEFSVEAVGEIYTNLIADLQKDPRFQPFGLENAATIQPKAPGGLSIEGLAATPQKSLLIGFRNPLVGGELRDGVLANGKALVVELLNPLEVIKGGGGYFADPVVLDLGGFGIREITWRKHARYLIVAGPYHGNEAGEPFRLYEWDKAAGKLVFLDDADLKGLNVEVALFYPDAPDCVQLLSDDGKLDKGDRFRSLDVNLKP